MKFLETFFSNIRQRIKSPFFGSFIFSWIIINWKPISYFIYSKDKMLHKIIVIESSYENLGNALWRPLFLSLFYVIISPYVNQVINKLISTAAKNKRNEEHKIKMDQIDNAHELAIKEKELENILSGNRDISQLNEKIQSLNQENLNLKDTLQNKDKIIGDYGEQLNSVNLELQRANKNLQFEKNLKKDNELNEKKLNDEYEEFSKSKVFEDFITVSEVIAKGYSISNSHVEIQLIEKFRIDGLLKSSKNISKYELTSKGIYFWKKYLDSKF